MSNIQFPSSPENGMVFEAIPGLFYKYNAGSNAWVRLKGVDALGLATPLADGLMSKEDFNKLQDLIVPPPQSTLKGEECNTTFKSGTVGLYSFDGSLQISKNPRITNRTPYGSVDATSPWRLHKNTAGFDFRVPVERIIEEVEERNQLKKVQLQGEKGYKGKRGEPGRDRLDTGPVGPTGPAGTNSPFGATLTTEGIPFELAPGNNNRAIVDVTTEEVSENENYLVVTRANIGNPDACPALVTPQDFNSALIVALNTIEGGKLVKDQTITSGDCSLICRICASSVHHLNVEDIVCAIHDQFIVRVNQLKLEKEALVKSWLSTMINLFNEQKAALCCALENCRSRKRNERTRQYIETQRIQAAIGDFSLLIDGGAEGRQVTDMDAFKDCPVPQETTPSIEIEDDCVIATLDAKIHTIDPRASSSAPTVSTFLQPGSYMAEITECCANLNDSSNSPAYSGRVALLYNAFVSVGEGNEQRANIEQQVLTFPDFGTFSNEAAAKNAYQGVALTFEHGGGEVALWLLDPDGFNSNNSGQVKVTIKPFEFAEATAPSSSGLVYVYRDEISFDGLLGRIVPFTGGISAAENLGALEDDVDLVVGPPLVKDRAQLFFFNGTDGLSLFFVAGEQPDSDNEQVANILLDIGITNNTTMTFTRGATKSADVKQISSSQYQSSLSIDGNSAGYAIGEIDLNADFSIEIDPRDLSTMRQFIAADPDFNNILLAEGGSEGIGGTIALFPDSTAQLLRDSSVPDDYGGGSMYGMFIYNTVSGQSIYVSRPITIDISATFNPPEETPSSVPEEDVPSFPESQILKTKDENMLTNNWDGQTLSGGRGLGTLTSISSGGNPGSYRQVTHSTGSEQRRIVSTGRPTSSYYGPGSVPALPWDQSYATDQFGNTWVFIRNVKGSPSRNGNGDIFVRDALASETWVGQAFPERIAANIFPGGSSGIAPGTAATGDVPSDTTVISTFDIFQGISYTPAELGELYAVDLNLDIAPNGNFEVGVALYQNGKKYASSKTTNVGASSWKSIGVNGGVPTNFGLVGSDGSINMGVNPDFTSTNPILFGYYVKSTHTSTTPEERTIGIDNWTICLTVPPSTPGIPTTPGIPPAIIEEKGEFVGEEASMLPRGASGSPQDPCIADITISISSSLPQSMRYILTDDDGIKFYSAYQTYDVTRIGQFQLMAFGPPVTALSPPAEFTPEVINNKTINTSIVADKLTATQLRIAESLEGISRLSYIQSILGESVDAIPNSRKITDIEFQTRNTPATGITVGFVSAQVGLPGAITNVLIDNFEAQEVVVGQSEAEPERVQGSIKRVVATRTGSDSQSTGLLYSGIDNYYGDYNGFDTFIKKGVDFTGNNFFSLNRAGDKLTQITAARGFEEVKTTPNGQALTTNSGNVLSADSIVVDDFGVVYVADGPAGEIIAYIAANAQILNTSYGDVHSEAANVRYVLASGLPKVDNAIITIGETNMNGANIVHEIIANFGGTWYKVNGAPATLLVNSPAARADTTTLRCCFGGNPPGPARPIALIGGAQPVQNIGSGPAGNSITVDKPANPQPSLPVPSNKFNQGLVDAVQSELDRDFNQFNLYVLDEDKIYQVDRNNGSRTLYRELGEKAFGLRANPRTKDLYFITNDRGTDLPSGTRIRRVDIDDLDEENGNLPRIKTVYRSEEGEGIFGITFGNAVPADPTLQNQVLYALLSTLENSGSGKAVTTRLVEVAEVVFPPVPSSPISAQIPLNSTWSITTSDGRLPGNPSKIIFSTLVPGGSCQMHYKQVQWYERGWRIGACCGALVELDGMYYIVVKRSIGTDLSCGGGESLSNSCISQYINVGEGHPAIAWPTSEPLGPPPGGGGDEFLGIPTSGFVNFVKDESLSNSLLGKIQSGNVLRTIGSPASEIPFILFPAT